MLYVDMNSKVFPVDCNFGCLIRNFRFTVISTHYFQELNFMMGCLISIIGISKTTFAFCSYNRCSFFCKHNVFCVLFEYIYIYFLQFFYVFRCRTECIRNNCKYLKSYSAAGRNAAVNSIVTKLISI